MWIRSFHNCDRRKRRIHAFKELVLYKNNENKYKNNEFNVKVDNALMNTNLKTKTCLSS